MYILKLSCKDQMGIVLGISSFIFNNGGDIVESAQFSDWETKNFFMRVSFQFKSSKPHDFEKQLKSLADRFQITWELGTAEEKTRVLIMVSKASHCLSHLLHKYRTNALNIEIIGIVSNHKNLKNLADWHQIPFHYLPITETTKAKQEKKLLQILQNEKIDLLVLARYMQVLGANVTDKVYGACINIHHSFLPCFKGKTPYQQAYDKGVKIIGATAHYVSQDLDEGPIIEQEILYINHSYNYKALVAAGKDIENLVLTRAIEKHIEKRVFINGQKTVVLE